jgi:mycoredoxin
MNTNGQGMWRVLGTALGCGLFITVAGCGETRVERPASAADVAPMPTSIPVAEGGDGRVFRYRDPTTGEVATAATRDAIPEAARKSVVVFDPAVAPPAGADFVADLSGAPPWTAHAVQGFAFPPPVASPTPKAEGRRSAEIVLFATEWCGYCSKARKFFESRKIPFTEIDIEKDPRGEARLGELARRAGVDRASLSGVPILFINGKVVAGWDEAQVKRLLGDG